MTTQSRQIRITKQMAQAAVRDAIKSGDLVRPAVCSVKGCTETTKIEAHHHRGYEKENWINVVWLCKRHHWQANDQQRKGIENPVFTLLAIPPKPVLRTGDNWQQVLQNLHTTSGMSWREIANLPEFQGIPAGTLCSISKGFEPKNPKVRVQLGLSAQALAPVCPTCGVVHVTKRCPTKRIITKWRDLPTEQLAWAILNREPFK